MTRPNGIEQRCEPWENVECAGGPLPTVSPDDLQDPQSPNDQEPALTSIFAPASDNYEVAA